MQQHINMGTTGRKKTSARVELVAKRVQYYINGCATGGESATGYQKGISTGVLQKSTGCKMTSTGVQRDLNRGATEVNKAHYDNNEQQGATKGVQRDPNRGATEIKKTQHDINNEQQNSTGCNIMSTGHSKTSTGIQQDIK